MIDSFLGFQNYRGRHVNNGRVQEKHRIKLKKKNEKEELTSLLLMLGTFTRLSWMPDSVPLAGRWSVTTRALDICCWARNFIALCSAVSISVSSAFLINAD